MKPKTSAALKSPRKKTKRNTDPSAPPVHHPGVEDELREYQQILANAEEIANIGSWKWDFRSQKVTWSDEMFRLFGVEREGFDGNLNRVITERIHPEDVAAVKEANRRVLEEAHPIPLSYRILLPGGMERTVWAQGKLILDETGQPQALTGYVQDITERVQAERKILQLKRLYATLSQVNQMIVRVKERDELFRTICDVAVQFGEFTLAWVGLFDEKSCEVRPLASRSLDQFQLTSFNIRMEEHKHSLIAESIRTSKVKTSEYVLTDAARSGPDGHFQSLPYRSTAIIPFQLRGKPVGILALFSREPGVFRDEDEIRLLDEMGLDISFALDNMENEKERQQAEKEIWSLAKFPGENPNPVLRIADNGVLLYANQSSQPLIRLWKGAVGARLPDEICKIISEVREGGTYREIELHCDDRIFTVAFIPITNTGYVNGYGRDITESRRAEAKAAYQSYLLENVHDAVLATDSQFRITSWNHAAEELYGYTEKEALGKKAQEVVRSTFDEEQRADAVRALNEKGAYRTEVLQSHRDGRQFWVEGNTLALKEPHGQIKGYVSINRDITERKQAEERLRQSEERYRLISDNSADVIWVMDPVAGDFKYVSPSVQKLRGYTPAEVMAQPVAAALTPDSLQRVNELLKSNLPSFMKQGSGILTDINEVDQPRKDGSIVHTEVTTTFTFNPQGQVQIIGISRDITERKQAEEKIRSRSRQLAALLEASQSLTESLDLAEVLQKITDKSADVLEAETTAIYLVEDSHLYLGACTPPLPADFPETMRRSELEEHPHIARAVSTLQPVNITDAHFARLTEAEQNISTALGLRTIVYLPLIDRKDAIGILILGTIGKTREFTSDEMDLVRALSNQAVLAITNAKLYKNLALHVTTLEREITERKLVQDELRTLNLELEERVQQRTMELSHANRAKDEFLANMSHELRTPLNTVLGLSETLLEQRRGPLNEKQVKSLELISSSGQHLLSVINDILEVSKIEAGKLELHPTRVYVKELCESSLNFIKQMAVKKLIRVEYHADETISSFRADPQRVKQVLINLLTNAVKFTPDRGSVTLRVSTNDEKDQILFSIIDTGIGIAEDDLKKLFTPFVQLDSSLARQFPGTGLGLALVLKLTELHGGSIQVESKINKGSCFTIVLPLDRSLPEPAPTENIPAPANTLSHSSTTSPVAPQQRGTILLAEDSRINSEMMSEYLEAQGYRVIKARDGEEVLQKVLEMTPDLIVMDIQMPKLDGLEATRQLRVDPRFTSTPIIALTALAMPGDKERCFEAGVNEYLSKPVSLRKLFQIIERLAS